MAIGGNKFFQTNVDFAAPIKALQKPQQVGGNLSEDEEEDGYLPAGVQPQVIEGVNGF